MNTISNKAMESRVDAFVMALAEDAALLGAVDAGSANLYATIARDTADGMDKVTQQAAIHHAYSVPDWEVLKPSQRAAKYGDLIAARVKLLLQYVTDAHRAKGAGIALVDNKGAVRARSKVNDESAKAKDAAKPQVAPRVTNAAPQVDEASPSVFTAGGARELLAWLAIDAGKAARNECATQILALAAIVQKDSAKPAKPTKPANKAPSTIAPVVAAKPLAMPMTARA